MNFFNVSRAVRGLIAYARRHVGSASASRSWSSPMTPATSPAISPSSARRSAAELGCDAFLYESGRATPQLSFTIRELRADAGVVLTASHNPAHDNGFKAYFNDGAQIVEPHASAIIAEVNALESEIYEALPAAEQGTITTLGAEMDRRYMDRLKSLLMQPKLLEGSPRPAWFTPISTASAA
jgi:phosphoglucomutase